MASFIPRYSTDLFLYSYEADFIQEGLLKKNEKKLTRSFNFTFRYIDDVLSLNNSRFSILIGTTSSGISYQLRDRYSICGCCWNVATYKWKVHNVKISFVVKFLKKNEKKLTRSFNFTFRYIDDVLSLNNSRFSDFVDRIYPIELEIKNTTDTDMSASNLDIHLRIN
jgi:hypothetical protein